MGCLVAFDIRLFDPTEDISKPAPRNKAIIIVASGSSFNEGHESRGRISTGVLML